MFSTSFKMLTDTDTDVDYNPTIRVLEIEKRDADNCGFHVTRGKWDPYPWISAVEAGSPASAAGMCPGDCLLEVNGEDVVGKRISEVAQLVKMHPNQVTLLIWNAGIDAQCSPEALCCGPMPSNLQKLSACMTSILSFLECPVCLDTIPPPTYTCDNGHLICMRCRTKSERCPVCRIRFNKGRSLFADQIYNAILDAFDLREETQEIRSAKIHQIFKLKSNKHSLPGIKVTQAHTNKILARLIGKSSSVDNLSNKNHTRPNYLTVEQEFSSNLKTKSHSSSEIFNASPSISRSSSINALNRTQKILNRPISYYGSFESLNDIHEVQTNDGVLYYCPFNQECSSLLKGNDVVRHFQTNHDGPLIQYFQPQIKLFLHEEQPEGSYIINIEEKVYFLKMIRNYIKSSSNHYDIRIWAWHLGNKKQSAQYQLHINLFNKNEEGNILMSIRNPIYSLTSVSWSEIKDTNKCVFISSDTLKAISTSNTLIDVNILKCDNQM